MNGVTEATVGRVVSRDGTEIAWWSSGTGSPLVLVHGSLCDHTHLDPLVAELREHITTFSMDRRGAASGDAAGYDIERECRAEDGWRYRPGRLDGLTPRPGRVDGLTAPGPPADRVRVPSRPQGRDRPGRGGDLGRPGPGAGGPCPPGAPDRPGRGRRRNPPVHPAPISLSG